MEKRVHVMTNKPVVKDVEDAVNFPDLNDGVEKLIAQLLHEKTETQEFNKEYIRERLADKFFPKEAHEDHPRQKFMLGQLVNEVYDKFTDQVNLDNFTNATTKLMNTFMAKDFLFCKNNLYSTKTDQDMFEALNEFTAEDTLSLMLARVYSTLAREKARLMKWKANLENHLLSNLVLQEDEICTDRFPSLTARSKSFNTTCHQVKEQLRKLETEIMRLHEETNMLQKYRTDLKLELEGVRGCFEKPNIDISAKVKMSSKHDHQALDKMLFNMRENKDLVIGLSTNKVEHSIIEEIADMHKHSHARLLHSYLKIVPNVVYARTLSQNNERLFSRVDPRIHILRTARQETPDIVLKLDQVGMDLKEIPSQASAKSTNFYEYILQESFQHQEFYKFVFAKRKLTNLTISSQSLDFMVYSWRLDEQGIGKTFKELVGKPLGKSYFKETENFPGFVTEIIVASMPFFSEKTFAAKFKTLGDQGVQSPAVTAEDKLLNKSGTVTENEAILKLWYGLLRDNEKLELFNQQVDNQFMALIQLQNKYIEFGDYYDNEKAFDINKFSKVGHKSETDDSKSLFKRLVNYINADEKIKIKKAFWIKEGLIFKLTQKQPNEHHASILLKDQVKHPYAESWLQLVLNNEPNTINYDLLKFTTDMFEVLNINQESLLTEKKLTKGTLESYVKLLMLRSRNAILRLISYCNFSRAVQKNINLRFIDLCEQHREQEDLFEKSNLDKYRRDDLLKQTRMYDRRECEEVRRIFDEEISVCS